MIGGTDISLWVREDIPAADMVLRVLRRHWPDFVCQDGNDETASFLKPIPWLPNSLGPEFFVYRDEVAARSWEDNGATAENANTMVYVIQSGLKLPNTDLVDVTLVCSELSGEMEQIIHEIQNALRDATEGMRSVSKLEAA